MHAATPPVPPLPSWYGDELSMRTTQF